MNGYVAVIIYALLTILCATLRHAYFYAPVKEIKRRATRENRLLLQLYRVSVHDVTARVTFSLLTVVFSILTIITIVHTEDSLTAFVAITIFVGLVRYVLRKNSRLGVQLASWLAQYLEPVLRRLEPLIMRVFSPKRKRPIITQLYEKDDLKEVLRIQKKAVNNRIPVNEIDNALHALDFGHKKIKDYMVPHSDIEFVTAKEPIGPILLSELHKSGFSCFPVQGNNKHEVLGILRLEDLVEHTEGGVVSDVMDQAITYVPEDQSLEYVLQAFSQTGKQFFMVLDQREKIVGLITMRDVLEQVLGHTLRDGIESYTDPAVVAHS